MIPFPDKKFAVIYADPPWSYNNKGTRAAADKHYGTMSIADIKQLPVGDTGGGGSLLTTASCLSGRPSPCCARPSR